MLLSFSLMDPARYIYHFHQCVQYTVFFETKVCKFKGTTVHSTKYSKLRISVFSPAEVVHNWAQENLQNVLHNSSKLQIFFDI